MLRNKSPLLFVLALLLLLPACGQKPADEPTGKVYFQYFDTVSYVYNYAGDTAETFDARSAAVADILSEYHQLFDIYHEYSGISNLCTVNRLAGGEPVAVDEKLIDFLLYARQLHRQTEGEMNIMMGAVLRLWHDCRQAAGEDPSAARLPDEAQLTEAAGHTSFDLLEIDEAAGTVRLTDPSAAIDVGALGKGYAVEQAARHLQQQGVSGYVLNVGGNIRIVGTKPDGSGWVTGVKDPSGQEGSYAVKLNLADTSCVTSGNYERYYTVDGVRYHHIIDADTLYPARHCASVTVITRDSAVADALSTALFCMSREEGLELLRAFPGVEVLWIMEDGSVHQTEGLAALLAN